MKIKKLGSSLAATTLLVGLSTVAMADPMTCEDLASDIYNLSAELRCADYGDAHTGYYNKSNALWEKRGQPSCDVHESLAAKLFFDRSITGEPPPVKKGGNANGGAAQDLLNGKLDAAYTKLESFLMDVAGSRDNDEWDATAGDKSEQDFVDAVTAIMGDVYTCY